MDARARAPLFSIPGRSFRRDVDPGRLSACPRLTAFSSKTTDSPRSVLRRSINFPGPSPSRRPLFPDPIQRGGRLCSAHVSLPFNLPRFHPPRTRSFLPALRPRFRIHFIPRQPRDRASDLHGLIKRLFVVRCARTYILLTLVVTRARDLHVHIRKTARFRFPDSAMVYTREMLVHLC